MEINEVLHRIIDLREMQRLFNSFYNLTKIPVSIVNLNGEVLRQSDGQYIGAGWQSACTRFHRQHPNSAKNCIVSDSYLANQLRNGKKYSVYKCLNGLIDIAVPLYYNNLHIANLFSGQFFLEPPDLLFFKANARSYGYHESEYLESIQSIPVFSDAKVQEIIAFLESISHLIRLQEDDQDSTLTSANSVQECAERITDDYFTQNEVFTSTLLSLDDFVYSLDKNGCFEDYYTPFKTTLFESDYDFLRGKHYSKIGMNPQFVNDLNKAIHEVQKTRTPSDFTFSLNSSGKTKIYYKASVSYRNSALGTFAGTTLHIRDITQEAITFEEVKKLSTVVEQSPVAIIITSTTGNIEYVNQQFTINTGYELHEVIGKNPRILKSKNTPNHLFKELWETITQGNIWHGEFLNKRKDGSFFWEEATISPVKSNDTITHYMAVKADITKRKELEEELLKYKNHLEELVVKRTKELQRTERSYKEIVEYLPGIVWQVDMNGIIEYVSPNISRYSDFEDHQLINKPISFLFDPQLHNKLYSFMSQFPDTPKEFFDFEVFLSKNEKRRYFNSSGKPLYNKQNRVIGIRGLSIDVTEKKQQEQELLNIIWKTEEKERKRIAMELHDSLGSTLSACSMYMNTLQTKSKNDCLINTVDHLIKKAVSDTREIANNLIPADVAKLGLAGCLETLRSTYAGRNNLTFYLQTNNLQADLEKDLELVLYRVVCELVNNSVNHGKATEISINLFSMDNKLYLIFEDNGNGDFNISEVISSSGMGIKNIIARIGALGGYCHFDPIPHVGLIVCIEVDISP